ncbi:hypothetical protein ARMGADRAFT_1035857 [Armillaria gallica]|uniref:Uncharacterized protein n=1 Tax=Armillaria gallica TaxID=47427 RepID=A0A2H3CSX5_ARMGA|nr:hypothetical protein ARMGADRAFT_1035857 [Armillaria gallica]
MSHCKGNRPITISFMKACYFKTVKTAQPNPEEDMKAFGNPTVMHWSCTSKAAWSFEDVAKRKDGCHKISKHNFPRPQVDGSLSDEQAWNLRGEILAEPKHDGTEERKPRICLFQTRLQIVWPESLRSKPHGNQLAQKFQGQTMQSQCPTVQAIRHADSEPRIGTEVFRNLSLAEPNSCRALFLARKMKPNKHTLKPCGAKPHGSQYIFVVDRPFVSKFQSQIPCGAGPTRHQPYFLLRCPLETSDKVYLEALRGSNSPRHTLEALGTLILRRELTEQLNLYRESRHGFPQDRNTSGCIQSAREPSAWKRETAAPSWDGRSGSIE